MQLSAQDKEIKRSQAEWQPIVSPIIQIAAFLTPFTEWADRTAGAKRNCVNEPNKPTARKTIGK